MGQGHNKAIPPAAVVNTNQLIIREFAQRLATSFVHIMELATGN
jgi:hypothetical protein